MPHDTDTSFAAAGTGAVITDMTILGRQARQAERLRPNASGLAKAQALSAMAARLQQNKAVLQAENARDLAAAEKNQLAPALLDRLKLSDKAIETMAAGLLQIADMPDPIGSQTATAIRPNGMRVAQIRMPPGVITKPRRRRSGQE